MTGPNTFSVSVWCSAATGSLGFLQQRSHLEGYDAARFQNQSHALNQATTHVVGFVPFVVDITNQVKFGGADNVLAQLEAIGTDIGSRNAADYLDLSIIEALKQEGYFAQLDKIYPMKP